MNGHQFDSLVRQFAQGEIRRRQLVIGSLALAVGAPGAARLALAQEADPTPTSSSIQGQSGATEQQFPCPEPTDPFGWLCGTGPFIPWYPIIAPPDITALAGIRWYGVQELENGGLNSTAFTRTGQELSHYRAERADDRLHWSVDGVGASINGFLDPPSVDGSTLAIRGEINGVGVRSTVGPDGMSEPVTDRPLELTPDQELLLSLWQPVVERVDALLELSLATEQNPLAASDDDKCFRAGGILMGGIALCAFTGVGCVVAGGAGLYAGINCTSSW